MIFPAEMRRWVKLMDNREKGSNNDLKSKSNEIPESEKSDLEISKRDLSASENPATDSSDLDEIVTLARRFYATGFPNPDRSGCPAPGEIGKAVSSGRAPGKELREHLFECSECFSEYRQSLAQSRNERAEWRRFASMITSIPVMKRVWMPAITFGLMLVGVIIWRQFTINAPKESIAGQNPPAARNDGAGESTKKKNSETLNAQTAELAKPQGKQEATGGISRSLNTREKPAKDLELDLAENTIFRRSEGANSEFVLPAILTRLNLRLPETSLAGKYKVGLINEVGDVLLSETAVSRDGAVLSVTLDLSRVTPRRYRLRVARNNEAPNYFEVVVRKR